MRILTQLVVALRRVGKARIPALLCALVCGLGFASPAFAQSGTVTPFVVCADYNPVSTKEWAVLSYQSSYPHKVYLEGATLSNYFTPGDPDVGQPEYFYPGTDQDYFSTSWYVSNYDALTWVIDGNTLNMTYNTPMPPCRGSYFVPAAPLQFSAAGTYTSQYLGMLSNITGVPTAIAVPVTSGVVSATNLQVSTTPPPGVQSPTNSVAYYIYGDVTVQPGPQAANSLLVQVSSNGQQVALGQLQVSYAGQAASTTGCPTTVTGSVQGSLGATNQLYGTTIWTQVVTLKNTSGAAIAGPIHLALQNLSSNARLFTAEGTGTCPAIAGAPYVTLASGLAANANAAVVLTFTDSGVPSTAITYTPVVVAGGSHL